LKERKEKVTFEGNQILFKRRKRSFGISNYFHIFKQYREHK